jgi:hypothetical protein
VPHVDAEQPGEAVEMTLPFGVEQVAAFAADEDRKIARPGVFAGERWTEVTASFRS